MEVARWTGRDAAALRQARRISIRAYAAHLGVAVATVSNWESRGEQARLRTETQQLLDIDLACASADVHQRFEASLAPTAQLIADNHLTALTGEQVEYSTLDFTRSTPQTLAELPPIGNLLQPLTAKTGRRVGPGTVRDLAARVHRLRLADDVLAGGDLIAPAFRDLRAALKLFGETSHTEDTGRGLLVQVGELAQVAGWIASDAGRHDLAERAYGIGITATRQADDATLAANLVGSLAYQHANTGRECEGVELAHAALEEAGPHAPPKARALFLDRLAWAHTKVGQTQSAMRALGEAHDALCADRADETPPWAYWVSSEELNVMDARVYTELHRPLRAVPLLSRVLERYDATHARELALYLSWLAIAYADANEPEAAASITTRMLDLSADLASDCVAERTRVVLRRLVEFDDVPEVRA